eukprot:Gregarina_sp_Poly_1__7942@NODE_453_length_8283_cov_172_211173_g76_i1_p3_GENE_NODE_453_length_8283_cov_172_211173_g76_i1NODE_453_length_8283_cov_172_211173_g76_i1_p3_ORF_typecomplete_len396_score35_49UQ_con/PF00179_26/7_2e23ProkE2_B/PF14461_6/0_00011_NODE_453_length_8283_cov_172_211173_g76_i147155902
MTSGNSSNNEDDHKSPKNHEKLDMLSSRSPDQPTGQSIRRILREWKEISTNQNAFWTANPINPDEPYEWHFTVRGPTGTAFEGGVYHGRLVLPTTYPMTPPTLFFLTPNGRFEVHKKVCLSATNFHPESWQPAWGIRSILDALHAFFPSPAEGAVNALDWPDHFRRQLAETSLNFVCPVCQKSNREIANEHCPPLVSGARQATEPVSASPIITKPEHPVASASDQLTASKPVKTVPPEEDAEKRLEEIRRRRTPQTARSHSSPSHEKLLHYFPSIVVFLYYLSFFLIQLGGASFVAVLMRLLGSPGSRGRQLVPLHLIAIVFCFLVIVYAVILLLSFAKQVFSETFFLFDVPIRQTFQMTTNPSPDQIRELSNAERYEDFPLHPFIRALFDAIWT